MEILTTFPHLQHEIQVIRRYEGWSYTKLQLYVIFYLETDWSSIPITMHLNKANETSKYMLYYVQPYSKLHLPLSLTTMLFLHAYSSNITS